MSAISFGLAATAILVSMFLVMALVEHLIIPRMSLLRSRNTARESPPEVRLSPAPVQSHEKAGSSLAVGGNPHARDVFVVMPGEEHPTFLAQLAPLPSPREGSRWPPSHYASSAACM
ncbi:uncharacterized protein LOC121985867 [Zingiber officinale]|uniref:uncharacterized protein LOC121982001 n=1 Tax=Zingiber officinale TaxID=94328 RepID=UPI001C4BCB25|nr:uncharacterized protein LOC121982001 [Zingiber officinale]XP_042395499.1 uncharacterized protein LOC121985867 [Zingiber officinale]